jgi:hypothetical protein
MVKKKKNVQRPTPNAQSRTRRAWERSSNYLDFDEYLRLPETLRDDPQRVAHMAVEGLRALLLPLPALEWKGA